MDHLQEDALAAVAADGWFSSLAFQWVCVLRSSRMSLRACRTNVIVPHFKLKSKCEVPH